jgi:hypothetical protein
MSIKPAIPKFKIPGAAVLAQFRKDMAGRKPMSAAFSGFPNWTPLS